MRAATTLILALAASAGTAPPAAAALASPRARREAPAAVTAARLTSAAATDACLAHLSRGHAPLLVAAGASFTAGVGSSVRAAWSVDLARRLGWRALVVGVPGMGYVRRGEHLLGPVGALLATLPLARLRPALVILQLGHDDIGAPLPLLRTRVRAVVSGVRSELPHAELAAITVFFRGSAPGPAARATNRAIVQTIRSSAPNAIVLDPLRQNWHFARARHGGLHPSAVGAREIAQRVEASLLAHGLHPYRATRASALLVPGTEPVCSLVAGGLAHVPARAPRDGANAARRASAR